MKERELPDSGSGGETARALLLATWPALVTVFLFHLGFQKWPDKMVASLAFNVLFLLTFTYLAGALPHPRLRTWALRGIALLLALLVFLFVYHYLIFGQILGISSVYAMVDTNVAEAREFVASFFRPWAMVKALLVSVPLLYLAWRPPYRAGLPAGARQIAMAGLLATQAIMWQDGFSRILIGVLVAALPLFWIALHPRHLSGRQRHDWVLPVSAYSTLFVLACVCSYNTKWVNANNAIVYPGSLIQESLEQQQKIEAMEHRMFDARSLHVTSGFAGPVTHVLVIGESTTRRHMSLYGYRRDTNPLLSRVASQLDIARNDCSSRTTTVGAIREMLTFATREDETPLYTEPSIVQLMKAAGYRTYWISNQQAVGEYDSAITVFAEPVAERVYVNKRTWAEGNSKDERVLPPLEQALHDGAQQRFIIVHLIGTHPYYKLRYPKSFNVFKSTSDIPKQLMAMWKRPTSPQTYNEYDNAVLYNDYIVSRIFHDVQQLPNATFTYLSDHGEVVGDRMEYFGHVGEAPDRVTYDVPLMFWMSPSVKAKLGDKVKDLQGNIDKPYQTDRLINTLLDMYDVNYPKMYRASDSLMSSSFQPRPRRCDAVKYQTPHWQ